MTILSIITIFLIIIVLLDFAVKKIVKSIKKEFQYNFNAFKYKYSNGKIIPLLKQDVFKTGVPIIEVKINNKPYKFILDSGANINLIDATAFADFDSESIIKEKSDGFLTAGEYKEDNIMSAQFDFEIEGVKYSEQFEVADMSASFGSSIIEEGVNIQGILGSVFFNKQRWSIDFENLVIWTK